jgi:hypothetical protein
MPPKRRLALWRRTHPEQSSVKALEGWPSDARIKHLEFIQGIVSRLATNSFVTKGWALTVAAAIYGFAANHLNPWIAAVGFVPTLGFWWLDAYFLRQERLFRCLYDDARRPDTAVALFSMHVRLYHSNPFVNWRKVIFSITLVLFYGMLLAVGLAIFCSGIIYHLDQSHSGRMRSAVVSRSSTEITGLEGHISPIRSPFQRGTK